MPRNYKYYNPFFTPMRYSPALWLDAYDASSLVMDGARTFNGSSQAFTKAHNSTHPDVSGDFWISAFIYLNATDASYRSAITKADSTTLADWIISKNNVNQMYFTVDYDSTDTPAAGVSVVSTVTMSAITWYHVFVYYDYSSGVIGISVNGESFVTATKARVLGVNSKTLNVGANANGTFNFWNGKLDSVAFGKSTAGWLASNATALRDYLYNSGSGRRSSDFLASAYYTGGNPSGAVSWWDMDARSGNETDRIGSNNLTDNGGVGYAAGVASGLVQYTGDPVKQWSDKSGNARHVTAASDAARPTYTIAAQNGLPGVTFDGVDDVMVSVTAASDWYWLTDGTKKYSIFSAVKFGSATDPETLYLLMGTTATVALGGGFYLAHDTRSGSSRDRQIVSLAATGASYVYLAESAVGSAPANTFLLMEGKYDPTNATASNRSLVSVNNGSYTGNNASSAAPFSTNQHTLQLGAGKNSSAVNTFFLAGLCGEIILFDRLLSSAESATVFRYLGNKWGITVL